MRLTTASRQASLAFMVAMALGLAGCVPGAQEPTTTSMPAKPATSTPTASPVSTVDRAATSRPSENSPSAETTIQSTSVADEQVEGQPTNVPAVRPSNIGWGVLRTGEPYTVEMIVDDVDAATFYLLVVNFNKDTGETSVPEIELNINGPGGEHLDMKSTSADGACMGAMMGYQCFAVHPSPGVWKVAVESKEEPEGNAGFSVQTTFEGGVQVVPTLSKQQVDPGEEIEITVTVQDPSPVEGANVSGFMFDRDPGVTNPYTASLQLTDRGGGVYSQRLAVPQKGVFSVVIYVDGTNTRGHAFARTETELLEVGTGNPNSPFGERPYETVTPAPDSREP